MMENLEFKLLAKCKQYIPELAELWMNEVGKNSDPQPSIEAVTQQFLEHCNEDKLPLTYVAIYQDKPIGIASLRVSEGIESNLTPWLGGLVVHPDYRGKKIGEQLVSIIKKQARALGYFQIYLLTHDWLIFWYEKLGWRNIETINEDKDAIMTTELNSELAIGSDFRLSVSDFTPS